MSWRAILGTLSLVLTALLFGYVAVTEQDRMAQFQLAYEARQVEVGAALFENNCTTCHGVNGEGIVGVAPALNAVDLLVSIDGKPPARLEEIKWAGAPADYVRSAIAGGRPRASQAFSTYPQRMPTWSQEFGGPLRADQINSLVSFIMNWAVELEKSGAANATPAPPVEGVGKDITVELPTGNAATGKALTEKIGCVACHITAPVGPAWLAAGGTAGIGARAEARLTESYTGKAKTPEQYLFESIVDPSAYIVSGGAYAANGVSLMPATYGDTLTKQDTADIIAYLETLK